MAKSIMQMLTRVSNEPIILANAAETLLQSWKPKASFGPAALVTELSEQALKLWFPDVELCQDEPRKGEKALACAKKALDRIGTVTMENQDDDKWPAVASLGHLNLHIATVSNCSLREITNTSSTKCMPIQDFVDCIRQSPRLSATPKKPSQMELTSWLKTE